MAARDSFYRYLIERSKQNIVVYFIRLQGISYNSYYNIIFPNLAVKNRAQMKYEYLNTCLKIAIQDLIMHTISDICSQVIPL